MAVRVDQNLERMRDVLRTGDAEVAALAIDADDDIDAMNVSLTERCYDLHRPGGAGGLATCGSSCRCSGCSASSSGSATSRCGW